MTLSWRDLFAATATLTSLLACGCGTSPPGAGFTNGDKATLGADEKPAVRDDLRMPPNPDSGDASLAGSAANIPQTGGNAPGDGGKGAVQGGSPTVPDSSPPQPAGTPPKIEAPAANDAAGGTRPPESIKTGTPRSPQ